MPVPSRDKPRRRLIHFRSFSTRVAVTIGLALVGLLGIVGLLVAAQLESQVFSSRLNAILNDASVRFVQAQNQMDQSTASTVEQVQELTASIVGSTADSAAGAGAISVMMLRSEASSEALAINEYADAELLPIVSGSLRREVASSRSAWQSVSIPDGRGSDPGIVVGAQLQVPLVGEYDFFILYSLASEQQTVATAVRTLAIATVPLAIAVAIVTFGLVYRTLRPVRSTANAAENIASGDLQTRVEVVGQDEMARLGVAFNDMADSLQNQIDEYDELSELQQRFVSDVSHELRTPLTTIRMAEEMIYDVREELDPVPKRSAELLHSEVARLEQMLADLLEISRYDAQSARLDWDTVDMYLLVERVISSTAELAEHLGIEVTLGERPARPTAEMDSKRIERVIRNLLLNAYEHAEGGPVEVEVADSANSVAVSVRDYGVGMDADVIGRVFDRFYRADPARTRTTGGTGLGLAIAKEDVNAHNGQLHADGIPGHGAIFVVTVPRTAGDPVFEFPLVARIERHES